MKDRARNYIAMVNFLGGVLNVAPKFDQRDNSGRLLVSEEVIKGKRDGRPLRRAQRIQDFGTEISERAKKEYEIAINNADKAEKLPSRFLEIPLTYLNTSIIPRTPDRSDLFVYSQVEVIADSRGVDRNVAQQSVERAIRRVTLKYHLGIGIGKPVEYETPDIYLAERLNNMAKIMLRMKV